MRSQQIIVRPRVQIFSIFVNWSIWQFQNSLSIQIFSTSFTDYYVYRAKQVNWSQDPLSKRFLWPSIQALVSNTDPWSKDGSDSLAWQGKFLNHNKHWKVEHIRTSNWIECYDKRTKCATENETKFSIRKKLLISS